MRYEAKIDLHGFTLQNAYQQFVGFIEYCHDEGVRDVLVITGKGNASTQTINYEFPHWCESPAVARYIRSFRQAEVIHGGTGAFYVRLRY